MRKIIVLLIALLIISNLTSAFAGEKTVFQIVGDSIEEDTKGKSVEIRPVKVDIFQKIYNHFTAASTNAKTHSLRTDKEELAERKGIK